MSFSDGLDTGTTPRFITLEVASLSHIIITALNGLQGTHLGHQAGKVKEALIENSEEYKSLKDCFEKFPYYHEDAKRFSEPDVRKQFLNKTKEQNDDTK